MQTIAVFRLAKGVLVIAAGVAALELLKPNMARAVMGWMRALPYASAHHVLQRALGKALSASPGKKEIAAAVAFAYGALFMTEGVGLWMEKVWAEYLTIIATASFIPFEIYEIVRQVSAFKIVILLANAAIVVYLIRRVRTQPRSGHA